MQNLEIKLRIDGNITFLDVELEQYRSDVLHQTDTYYQNSTGRLKLRQETGRKNKSYVIYYQREDTQDEKLSNYLFYDIPDVSLFKSVFGDSLITETVVTKRRVLYLYKNARIHLDTVEGLGSFLEVEVVITDGLTAKTSSTVMAEILAIVNGVPGLTIEKVACGYRELLNKVR